eukprot:3394375-Alexandrium_andersonii.AAC.1
MHAAAMQAVRAHTHLAFAHGLSQGRRTLRANSTCLWQGLASPPEPIPQAGHRGWCSYTQGLTAGS